MELHTGNKSFTSKQCLFLKPDFSLPFTPFFHGIIRRQKIFSTISLDQLLRPAYYVSSISFGTNLWQIYMKFQISETCLYVLISYICNLPMINHKFCYNSLYSNDSNFLANQFISSIHSNYTKSQKAQMILKVLIKCYILNSNRSEFLTSGERTYICEHAESDISICRNMEMTEHSHT